MHLKALGAVFATAMIAAAMATTANAKAQSINQQPTVKDNYVTVQSGDSLSAIASSHQSTYVRLFDANAAIKDPNLIYPGQKLRIPTADEQLPNRTLPSDIDPDMIPANQPEQPAVQPGQVSQTTASPATQNPTTGIWSELAQCESGGNWSADTGNGFYGGLQFTLSSWQAVGGSGYPNQASPAEQISRAEILQSRQGWGAWPVCSAKIGL